MRLMQGYSETTFATQIIPNDQKQTTMKKLTAIQTTTVNGGGARVN
jgi:hypothetical protein